MEATQKQTITAYKYIGLLTEWRRNRNMKYRELTGISHPDFISMVQADQESVENHMDFILPEEMHSRTKPSADNFNIIPS